MYINYSFLQCIKKGSIFFYKTDSFEQFSFSLLIIINARTFKIVWHQGDIKCKDTINLKYLTLDS